MSVPPRVRSFVDPTTNEMVVSDFDLPHYLAWVEGRPVRGSGVLANFLHEWTHRWCFHSRVGSALALLRMRAACREYQDRSAFDDYVRCMAASTVLEPFAEGLALFAEFDTYPGRSGWMSQTLTVSALFFSPALQTDGNPTLPLEGLLQQLRRDPQLLERKAGIYAAPVSVHDPYLLGYLAVRSLWGRLAAACRELNDRDLFLSYLRSYLYEDPTMVVRMLDSYPSELHAAEAIVNHLIGRVAELVSTEGLPGRVERWFRSAETGEVDVAAIGGNPADVDRANRMMELALVADVEDEASESLAAWMMMTLEERRICVVASAPVELRTAAAAGRVDVVAAGADAPLARVPAELAAGASEGEVVIVAPSAGTGMAVLLRVAQEVNVVSSSGRFPDEELQLAMRHVANRPITLGLHEEFRAGLQGSEVVSYVWELVAARVGPAMTELFGPLATLNSEEDEWREAFTWLQQGGIFGLLDHDPELTRALAAIGLANTVSTHSGVVSMICQSLGIEEETLKQAAALGTVHGLPLVARRDESILALV